MATINDVARAIEAFLRTYEARNAKAIDVQVRASGDDVDVIKVWVDIGPAAADAEDWATTAEAAIRKDVPGAAAFRLQVRVEKL